MDLRPIFFGKNIYFGLTMTYDTMISKIFFRFCIKREKFFLCFGGYDEKKNKH